MKISRETLYCLIVGLFVTTLIVSNLASVKLFDFFGTGLSLDGGAIIFPVSYVLGDLIAELYGFRGARRIIYTAFLMNLVLVAALAIVQILPPAAHWGGQLAYETTIGFLPRIIAGSLVAFVTGQLLNAFVFVKIKAATHGKHLWMRSLGSSLVGDAIDTALFITIAFAGTIPLGDFTGLLILAYLTKLTGEVLLQPVTYLSVHLARRVTGVARIDTKLRLADVLRFRK
jgi:uncharacterized integral membrane protein (TIGR00697 family)